MLFTTAVFVLLFLPIVLVGFYFSGSPRVAAAWLFLASLFFYGYWLPEFTLLLLASICFNFRIGLNIARHRSAQYGIEARPNRARTWLIAGVVVDLGVLAYFKYANFFIENLEAALGAKWGIAHVTLPIGISFFTFTQIAFLVDAYQKRVHDYGFVHYGLFVTYFPHLVAGPILHHSQMIPQFASPRTYAFDGGSFAAGLAVFGLGLLKKVVLADGISPFADAVFNAADAGRTPGMAEAWIGALAYALQLYFDFSGYSDMAIGLSRLFNIRLPINFNSPYRATSISDFWRRWHISLSTFLRDYLYIALGGNRHGSARRYANLLATMVLGGLWHGAGWSFVLWGALHGLYLVVNHGFRALLSEARRIRWDRSRSASVLSWALTMACVIVAWVFFRAGTFPGALTVLKAMAGQTASHEVPALFWDAGLDIGTGATWCLAAGIVALLPLNSNAIAQRMLEACTRRMNTRSAVAGFATVAVLLFVLIATAREVNSAFIYFNF